MAYVRFIIFLNMLLINWLSQKQPTIESSVFGAEFVAMKLGVEVLRGIWYKLHMMGVPIAGPMYVYGDKMSVIHNAQCPKSILKKKNLPICYHAVREAVAMGEVQFPLCGPRLISLTSWQRWPMDKSGTTWWAPYYLTFMMTIPIRKADLQKVLLNDCWMSKIVPSKSDLLLWSLNLRGLRKLDWVETRQFLPYLALLQREGAFFPELPAGGNDFLVISRMARASDTSNCIKRSCAYGEQNQNRITETTTNWPWQVE